MFSFDQHITIHRDENATTCQSLTRKSLYIIIHWSNYFLIFQINFKEGIKLTSARRRLILINF